MATLNDVRVLLQAGGRGERLRPDTDTVPKPLLPVGGVPMVERLFRQLLLAGAADFTVVTGWLGERVVEHLSALRDVPEGLALRFVTETSPLGNAGALRLLERGPGPALLIFGDLVTDLDFGALYDLHRARGSAVTLTSHWEGMRLRLGELTVEGDRVTDYQEKPEKRYLICSGVALFEQVALDCIPDQGMVGLVDAVRAAIHAGLPVGHWTHGAAWMDVNSHEALREADERFGASGR